MLDLVPFAGARREMRNDDGQLDFIAEFLELRFPESDSTTVAPTSISGDHQLSGL